MAGKVVWTQEAVETFNHNINYLLVEWSEREVRSFVRQTEKVIAQAGRYLNRILLALRARLTGRPV